MGIRTPDLLIANETLYQLSYTPKLIDFSQLHVTLPERQRCLSIPPETNEGKRHRRKPPSGTTETSSKYSKCLSFERHEINRNYYAIKKIRSKIKAHALRSESRIAVADRKLAEGNGASGWLENGKTSFQPGAFFPDILPAHLPRRLDLRSHRFVSRLFMMGRNCSARRKPCRTTEGTTLSSTDSASADPGHVGIVRRSPSRLRSPVHWPWKQVSRTLSKQLTSPAQITC
jgi:hypothetical protein